jgi:hypothetical protein
MPRDRFYFYELAVTNADMLARFCRALHLGTPATLREDFSGTAALARAWLTLDPAYRAIAVDHDPAVLLRANSQATRANTRRRLRTIAHDVLHTTAEPAKADIIAATNFPLGYFHTRRELVSYLRLARSRLNKHGVFLADTYGGTSSLSVGATKRTFVEPDGRRFVYVWDQIDTDPRTGLVRNAIHFQFLDAKGKKKWIRNAFTYHWRLWSIPELKDALADAGFREVEVHDRLGDAIDSEGRLFLAEPDPDHRLDPEWVAYVAARR